jgi:hypothetical protein
MRHSENGGTEQGLVAMRLAQEQRTDRDADDGMPATFSIQKLSQLHSIAES